MQEAVAKKMGGGMSTPPPPPPNISRELACSFVDRWHGHQPAHQPTHQPWNALDLLMESVDTCLREYNIDSCFQDFLRIRGGATVNSKLRSIADIMLKPDEHQSIPWGRVVVLFALTTRFEDSPAIREWLEYVLNLYRINYLQQYL